jgi:pyruvate dehydrogenase E2 component (dihydrolipoamide acetyltransferase)
MADITLPQLGETVTEGTITQWFKSVGERVNEDEPLFEVSTDKVDTEVPSTVSGVLTEIRVEAGETVDVGSVIAVVGGADDAIETAPETVVEPAPAPTPAAAPAPRGSDPAQPPPPARTQTAVTTRAPVQAGTNRLLSPVVRRIVAQHHLDIDSIRGTGPGGRITRDDVLGRIDAVDSTAHDVKPDDPEPAAAPARPAAPADAATTAAVASPRPPVQTITAGERDRSVRLSKIRQLTGDHMIMSKATSPHAFSVVEVDYSNVDLVRKAVRADWKSRHGFGLTYLPFIARAVIDGLRKFPHLNASVGASELVVHDYVDLGIAVDLDYDGVLAPVLRDADTKRLAAIAQQIHQVADRARNRTLAPDEISGGTFTISNNGSVGSVLTMPIINQPQVGIISTDAIVRKAVVVTTPDGGDAIAIHPVGNLSMSWDHRAFDGAYAAGFLSFVREMLESKDWTSEL